MHGVPGLEVDVLVDGVAAITGFSFGDVVKTTLPAGDYTFGVAATGTTTAILELEASLGAGLSATIAAEDAAPAAPPPPPRRSPRRLAAGRSTAPVGPSTSRSRPSGSPHPCRPSGSGPRAS